MPVTRTSNLPEPRWPNETPIPPLYPAQAHSTLDAAYSRLGPRERRPGRWSEDINRAPDRPLSPRQNLAFQDAVARLHASNMPDREQLELSISGQTCGYAFNRGTLVRHNIDRHGFPDYRNPNLQATLMQRAAAAMAGYGLIPRGSSLLEPGAGLGFFSHALSGWCRQTKALDMNRPPRELLAAMPGLDYEESTIEAFARSHPEARFDVVFAGHFSPAAVTAEDWLPKTRSYFKAASLLTEDHHGRFIVGVGSINPLYLTPDHPQCLLPLLGERFEQLQVVPSTAFPQEYEATGSIGGMMALVVAMRPRRSG